MYTFPAIFEGQPNITAMHKLLSNAKLRNITALGASAMCFYDGVVLQGQPLYMSNMGDMFGTIISWQVHGLFRLVTTPH